MTPSKKFRRAVLLCSVVTVLATLPHRASSQSMSYTGDSSGTGDSSIAVVSTSLNQMDLTYVRPTQRTKIINYVFDTYGPYPIASAAIMAGINQETNSPPEWNQGVKGYSKRFGSDFGIAAVGTTTRYGLSEAFQQDAMYYRCECSGLFRRTGYAMLSTLTARRGEDGHRAFSIPALFAPYVGSTTAVYGWYPDRFGPKDAFRIGNYNLLAYMGENIALEFFYSGPHSLLSRMHLNNAHGSLIKGPNR